MRDIKEKSPNPESSWCAEEFADVAFEDQRLNQRLVVLAESLSEYPLCPINQACKNAASAKAAYRFFANERANPAEILEAHKRQINLRAFGEDMVFVVQDTTFLNYSNHFQTSGLGLVGVTDMKFQRAGLVMHSCLVLDHDGLPLGIGASSSQFSRKGFSAGLSRKS